MKQVIAALCLLILGVAIAAPAPVARPKKGPPQVTSGEYYYAWGIEKNNLTLSSNGCYEADWVGMRYYGFWQWNRYTRTLEIWEACDVGAHDRMSRGIRTGWRYYKFELDNELMVKGGKDSLLWLKLGKVKVPPAKEVWF